MRDYALAARLLNCPDELHLTAEEVALLTGYSSETVRQRRVRNFPRPVGPARLLRWRLGDVRVWLSTPTAPPVVHASSRKARP
jgi:predicted DNA-binding transcriptional regulator AlpA